MEDDWLPVLVVWEKVTVLEFEVIPGSRAPTPRARTRATTTETVAPAAICLLNSDTGS